MSIDTIDNTIEQLEEIRRAIIAMQPSKSEASKLDKVYAAITTAQRELVELIGGAA